MRYQIVYSKADTARVTWKNTMEAAMKLADRLRICGYSVIVAEHSKRGSRIL